MKKLKYIIAFILIGLISYQPMNNFLLEKKRVEREKFISSYMDKNSFSYYEVKKIYNCFYYSWTCRIPTNQTNV